MKPSIILSTLGLLLVPSTGCNGEADIGIDSTPRTCATDGPAAEVHGTVIDPNSGTEYDFAATGATAIADTAGGGTVQIASDSLFLSARAS